MPALEKAVLTKHDALTADEFHHKTCANANGTTATGRSVRVRRNGQTQLWVTRPNDARIPVKFGFKSSGQFSIYLPREQDDWHTAQNCPFKATGDNQQMTDTTVEKFGYPCEFFDHSTPAFSHMRAWNHLQWRFAFDNGYGASVIQSDGSYGGRENLYELAVIHTDGAICYATPITSDVIGWLSETQVAALLPQIATLPVKRFCSHKANSK